MRLSFRKRAFLVSAVWLFLLGFAGTVCAADDYRTLRDRVREVFPQNTNAALEGVERARKADVPADALSLILSRTMELPLAADDFVHLVDRVTAARKDGLQTNPFTEKIVEGFAKNVPTPVLLDVLDKKLETYRVSKTIVTDATEKRIVDSGAVSAVALAMERGVSPRGLRQIYATGTYDPASISHSAQALADLESMGFKEDDGVRMVGAGLKAGYLRTSASVLTQVVARAKGLGRSNQDITEVLESGLNRGRDLSEIVAELHGGESEGKYGGMRGGRGGKGYGGPGNSGFSGKGSGGKGR